MSHSADHVLIVEDDPAIRLLLSSYFQKEGFKVFEADCAEKAKQIINEYNVSLALIDIVLESGDGLALTRDLRAESDVGIIVVSQKGDEIDRIVGIEMGADAYISKPFNPREVLAYAKNIIRRTKAPKSLGKKSEFKFDNFTLDAARRCLKDSSANTVEPLTRDEFALLHAFLQHPDEILTRDKLLNLMHGHDWLANDRTIDILVGRLRKKLNDNATSPRYITTIYGQGYIFNRPFSEGSSVSA